MSSGALIPIADLFNQAVEAFSRGDLARAADLCARIPIHAPAFGDSRHLAAVIAGRQGDALRAIALIAEFLSLCPADADAWADFAVLANNSGHSTAALNAAFRAINLAPNRLDWWQVAARVAMALHRYDLALPGWQLLTANEPQQVDFWYQRALSETALGRSDDAISSLAQVTRLDPANALAFERLGRLLFAGKRLGEAAFAFREWTRLRPNDAHAYLNFGVVLTEMGGEAEAAFACAQSMALEPGLYAAYTNLAAALYLKQLNFLPAHQLLDRAYRLNPHSADVQMNLAVTLQGLGQTGEARLAFHRAAAIRPADPESVYNQSLFELLHGNFREGLRFYEWRRLAGVGIMTQFDRPMWRGENLRGRHILIADEQGLGDTLQFCRYIPMIEKLGARVSVTVRDPLVSLLETLGPNIQVFKSSQAPTAFDCWAHMMSLPYLFGTELHTIPADVPYLHVPAEFIADAAKDINQGRKKKVGLVWSGSSVHKNDHNRSIPLKDLQPLFGLPNVEFYALQTEIRPSDQVTLSDMPKDQLRLIATPNSTFMQTAARILNLDLVISVDTSLAHLCGALGKDTWILLPVNPDWRWLLDRTDSPWYPTARLFRQRDYGIWSEVIQTVRDHLMDL